MKTDLIDIKLLENNTGQIEGVKQNPRDLTTDGFNKAVESIRSFPEMLEARELIVVPFNDHYVVIGGNQRLRALRELKYTEAPCKVVNWIPERINEFIIKDNVEYGKWDWDLIANEWEELLENMADWGLELPIKLELESEDYKVVEKTPTQFILTIITENKINIEVIKKELDRLNINYKESER